MRNGGERKLFLHYFSHRLKVGNFQLILKKLIERENGSGQRDANILESKLKFKIEHREHTTDSRQTSSEHRRGDGRVGQEAGADGQRHG